MEDDLDITAEAGLQVLHPHHEILTVEKSVADEVSFAHAMGAQVRDQDVAVSFFEVELGIGRHDGRHVVKAVDEDDDVSGRFFLCGNEVGVELDAVKCGHLPVEDVHAVAVKPVLSSSEDRALIDG